MHKKPTILLILDGWGMAPEDKSNAIALANTPNWDQLTKEYPFTTLCASGTCVGLDENQVSGSETGHMNIGAGRIVEQDSHYIMECIENGRFFDNPVLIKAVRHTKIFKSRLHIMGLMSNTDSPHSNPEHFRALLQLARENGATEVLCHLFTDGRDSYPKSALEHLAHFKKMIEEEDIGEIASISGRFYAMDRSKNWKRLAQAYDAIVFGRGEKAKTPEAAIESAYQQGLTDEYIVPTVICDEKEEARGIRENDSVIFFNYRSDRARQFTKLFVATNKERILADDMPIIDQVSNLYFAAMTDFGPDLDIHTAFPSRKVRNTLPFALKGYRQLYIAEREKFAHVTYFFNGGYDASVAGEERVMIESVHTDSYAKVPEMSTPEIVQQVLSALENDSYDFYVINLANADMVGHTGDIDATVKAIELLDACLGEIFQKVKAKGGQMVVTADHGNADHMRDDDEGQANTFHTKSEVPFLLASGKYNNTKLAKGILGNVAPTILEIMGVEKPKEMTCESLLAR